MRFFARVQCMSSKQVKTSVLLILGEHMECVKPNLSMSSCSDVRQQDENNVGDCLICCKGKIFPHEFLKFSGVGLDNFSLCLMNISIYRFLKN